MKHKGAERALFTLQVLVGGKQVKSLRQVPCLLLPDWNFNACYFSRSGTFRIFERTENNKQIRKDFMSEKQAAEYIRNHPYYKNWIERINPKGFVR